MRRLSRKQSRLGQIGCSLVISVLLGTLSFFILRYPLRHPEEKDLWLMYVVGGGFGLVAVILFFLGVVHQTLGLRTPETLLEMDGDALYPGKPATFRVQQPGNASFESLRVNLVCEEQLRGRKNSWSSRMVENINLLDSGPFDGTFEREFTFDVPRNLEPTSSELRRRVRWQLEVWGKVRGGADSQHVYPVSVLQKP